MLTSVDGCLVSLRLQRRPANAGPAREYELASGRLIHQAAGNPRDSRIEMMLALLGRMGRGDAAPLMARMAREDGSAALRWQALRECLALDYAGGLSSRSPPLPPPRAIRWLAQPQTCAPSWKNLSAARGARSMPRVIAVEDETAASPGGGLEALSARRFPPR